MHDCHAPASTAAPDLLKQTVMLVLAEGRSGSMTHDDLLRRLLHDGPDISVSEFEREVDLALVEMTDLGVVEQDSSAYRLADIAYTTLCLTEFAA